MLPAAHTGVKKQEMWQHQRVEEKGEFHRLYDPFKPGLVCVCGNKKNSMRTKKLAAMQSQPSHIEEKHVWGLLLCVWVSAAFGIVSSMGPFHLPSQSSPKFKKTVSLCAVSLLSLSSLWAETVATCKVTAHQQKESLQKYNSRLSNEYIEVANTAFWGVFHQTSQDP